MLEIDIEKRLRDFDLHLSLNVDRGQILMLVGDNGCGKTSLLKALTGFLPPSAGEFAVLGQHYGASDWRELRHHGRAQ